MSNERDLLTRLFMLVLCAIFGLATCFAYHAFGMGVSAFALGILALLSIWGYLSFSPIVRDMFSETVTA
jgi:hypothetical protein